MPSYVHPITGETHYVTYPAARGSRGYWNVFGTFLIPSSQSVFALGAAETWCEECATETTPESFYHPRSYAQRYNGTAPELAGWIMHPCHEFQCAQRYCTAVVHSDDYCHDCSQCESCCSCYSCYSCSDKVEFVCENCQFCDSCCECSFCEDCEEPRAETETIDYRQVCERCRDRNYSFCEDCDEYYHYDNSGDHEHSNGCDCIHPDTEFAFPNVLPFTVSANERITVEFPSGMISSEGIAEIVSAISNAQLVGPDRKCNCGQTDCDIVSPGRTLDYYDIRYLVSDVGTEWQTKDGNFTKRVSRAFYRAYKVKIPSDLVSAIGNIANANTAKTKTVRVEFTRDLNGSAEDFYHEDSCWWQSYSISRCALKNWGGIGIRSYRSDDCDSDSPSGRVWVQPLDETLSPTADAMRARAYVVYNAYGELEGTVAARIVSQLTGKTYKKISLNLVPQYVNGNAGYLIADEGTIADTAAIYLSHDAHRTFS